MRAKEVVELIAQVAKGNGIPNETKIRIIENLLSLYGGEPVVEEPKKKLGRPRKRNKKYARWSLADDKKLVQLVDQNLAWSRVAKEVGRTKGSCYNRYKKIKKQKLHFI